MKKNKPLYGWIFAVIVLTILLAISLYLGLSGWFFTTNFSRPTDLVLGNNVEIAVNKSQASTASFTFSGGYLQGEKLPQIVSVKNSSEEGKVFLRAKVYVFMSDNSISDMALAGNSNWNKADDGYYYFNDKLVYQGKVGLCSHVEVGEESKLCGALNYILTILVESLDENLDVEKVWGVDPIKLAENLGQNV